LGKLDLEGVGSVGPHDVAVLYVEPQAHGRVRVHELRQDYEGRFLDDWPDGFFPERLVELE